VSHRVSYDFVWYRIVWDGDVFVLVTKHTKLDCVLSIILMSLIDLIHYALVAMLCTTTTVSRSQLSGYALHTLEYVHVLVSLSHSRRGDVQLILVCPSGTSSVIGATRKLDDKY